MNDPEMVYYGHTCDTLSRRFSKHKSLLNNTASKSIIDKGDAIILLVEDYPCNNKMQAQFREAHYIINNNCVNEEKINSSYLITKCNTIEPSNI